MHVFKTCLSLLLSFAILLVGSAAASASVHTRCLMPNENMQSMNMTSNDSHSSSMHMDCMKMEKAKSPSHEGTCASEQSCIMYYAQLVYANASEAVIQPVAFSTVASSPSFISPNQSIPSAMPFGLWRPPRAI